MKPKFLSPKVFYIATATIVSLATQLLVAAPAKAGCVYEGTTYQTGETVGPLICMPDGSWQRNS